MYDSTTATEMILNENDILSKLQKDAKKLKTHAKEKELKGSSWVFVRILRIRLEIIKYQPLQAGKKHLTLPDWFNPPKRRNCVINPNNTDEKCFMWCIKIHLFKSLVLKNRCRITNYTKFDDITNYDCVECPVRVTDIPKFENNNKNLSINVFEIFGNGLRRIYKATNDVFSTNTINLLLVKNHYIYISKLDSLCFGKTKSQHRKFLCYNCMRHFNNKTRLEEHQMMCDIEGNAFPIMPKEGEVATFKNERSQFKEDFAVYVDFETFPTEINEGNKFHKHIPCSYSYYVVSKCEDIKFEPVLYRGKNCILNFIDKMYTLKHKLKTLKQRLKKTIIMLIV